MTGYTAAGEFPWKVLKHKDAVMGTAIKPIHLQLIPTNRCNSACPWCSCKEEDRTLELPIQEVIAIISRFKVLGTKAITITGGGEPTLHPNLQAILLHANDLDIETGIVTNGKTWTKPVDLVVENGLLTWARLSINNQTPEDVAQFCRNLPAVDVGFSCVVDSAHDWIWLCKLANDFPNVTHIRFVQNILNPDDTLMQTVEQECKPITHKAIFQYRSTYAVGTKNCRISLLKPVVGADGFIYPCCGVQYATTDTGHMPAAMRLCHWKDFGEKYFDGSKCLKCYYSMYNKLLEILTHPIAHQAFV